MSTLAITKPTSRAVQRDVEPGSAVDCESCGDPIKFRAKLRPKQVICNVYVDSRWDSVKHFHAGCYAATDEPYGEVDTTPVVKARRSKPRSDSDTVVS